MTMSGRSVTPSIALPLLALTTKTCPGHSVQAGFRDTMLADRTRAECALPDPSQCLFDRSQEAAIGSVQADLKLCFGLGIGLVNKVSMWAACFQYGSYPFSPGSRQLPPLGQQ
jgi:hypothetical protein